MLISFIGFSKNDFDFFINSANYDICLAFCKQIDSFINLFHYPNFFHKQEFCLCFILSTPPVMEFPDRVLKLFFRAENKNKNLA